MNFLKIFKKTPTSVSIQSISGNIPDEGKTVLETTAKLRVQEFLVNNNKEVVVHFITTKWVERNPNEVECLELNIFTPTPGRVIGIGGVTSKAISSFVGAKVKVPVYTKGTFFDPFTSQPPM